jgi:actin-like ATPase involved in cell morphogenesis
MFNAEVRRPMSDGLINPREKMALPVLEAIIQSLLPKAKTQGEILAFSVPAAPVGKEAELTYHEATLRRHFEGMGYKAVAINEGLAVVFSELEDNNFTGIGLSCGGGMCNGTLAFLSIPSIMFSIAKGGDYIDQAVGSVVGESATRVKVMKEEGLDLTRAPKDKFEKALHIYYEDLVESLVEALRRAMSRAEKMPKSDRPLPIVIAGGTAKPRGFKELFERALKGRNLPVEISGVRLAGDPLTATARGALIAAMYEK